ncbi:hypothetical protein JCM10213_004464 [Rhodosporidiobolus nylandii]
MRTAFTLVSLASLSSVALAQSGYGRFPCTVFNGDGTFSADQTQCANDALVVPGTGEGTPGLDSQGDLPAPTDPQCVIDSSSGAYFCGIAGATCQSDDNCDNGQCLDGVCSGGFATTCNGVDANCLGNLYCTDLFGGETATDTCGGVGTYCQDYTQGNVDLMPAENQAIFNNFCATGYCSYAQGVCDIHGGLGDSCASDPEFFCSAGLQCNTETQICEIAPVPSGARARARRDETNALAGGRRRNLFKKSLCPLAHEACSIEGTNGFECIDVQTNLEQCGACASNGGVDCTALPGVAAVGCNSGVCEIWSCEDGFTYDAAAGACTAN